MSGIFDKFKKKTEVKAEKHFHRYLILGNDLYSLKALELLKNKFGKDEVLLLSDKKLNSEDLHLFGPSSFRGDENLALVKKFFPAFEITKSEKPNLFLKEGEWKSFGGRSKGETLLPGEEFFVSPRILYKESDFFGTPVYSDESLLIRTPSKIYKQEPSDLVERVHWKVECVGGETFECEHIIWAYSPERFIRCLQSLDLFSKDFIESCEQMTSRCVFYVRLFYPEKITELKETLFIPLSYTHEWGHFIGEWSDEGEGMRGEFLHYISKEDLNEDEVAKRLRHLKKSFEKLFEKFDEKKLKDSLLLSENGGCWKTDDTQKNFSSEDTKNIFFIGENALFLLSEAERNLFEDSHRGSGFARALLTLELLSERFLKTDKEC